MALTFYPYTEDAQKGSLTDRIEILMEAAERYKTVILDESAKPAMADPTKRLVPRDMVAAYNWEEITRLLREIRELPEANKLDKTKKGNLLAKLAEVYEILRSARMSKLEAVRLALVSESNQLRGSASQVA
jgi:hypothetical protein